MSCRGQDNLKSVLCLLFAAVASQVAASPLSLDESVSLALRRSPQAHAAAYARAAARTQAERERPAARPTVSAFASGTLQEPRLNLPFPNSGQTPVYREQSGRVDLIVEQPIYRAGLRAALQRYSAQASIAEMDYRQALQDIAIAARKGYIDVLRAEAGLRAAEDGLQTATRYQSLVDRQIAAGLAKPVDADTAAAQVAEAQAGVTQAQGGLALARLAFNHALGRPLDTPVALEPLSSPPEIPLSPESAIRTALGNRVEISSLEQNLRASRAGVRLARSGSLPSLSVRGQVTEQTPTAIAPRDYAAATLELRWPLFDAGKTRLDVHEAQAQAGRLDALLEETQQAIALEVTEAWQKMLGARDRINLARTQRRGAEAAARVADTAYEVGRATAVEVQSAHREVRLARERELQATYDLEAAAADFKHAQGVGLPPGALESSDPSTGRRP